MDFESLRGKKILHIDDDADFRLLLKTQLKARTPSLVVLSTINGHHALQLLRNHSFDAILCDYMLPDMTGLNLMIGCRDFGVDSPFIFVSSREEDSLISKTMQFGAHSFHNKLIIAKNIDILVNSLLDSVYRNGNSPQPRQPDEDERRDQPYLPRF